MAESGTPTFSQLQVGQRVVLEPWLAPWDRSPLWLVRTATSSCSVGTSPLAAGIHTGTSRDAQGGSPKHSTAYELMSLCSRLHQR